MSSVDTSNAGAAARLRYRMVLPPGWLEVPLDDRAEALVHQFAVETARGVSADRRGAAVRVVEEQLLAGVSAARQQGGQDFFLPTEAIDGVPLPLSIVVSVSDRPEGVGPSAAEALLSFSAGDDSAQAVTLGSQLAIRRLADVAAEYGADGAVTVPASRRISYLTTPPNDDRLMVITASILRIEVAEGAELLEAMEFLVDAVVRTIRFEMPEGTARDDRGGASA